MASEDKGAERPQPRLAQGREHVVATVDEIPPGSHKLVPIGRHGVGVYNVNGTFHAIANYCPHQGGPLCSGRPRGRTVVDESTPGDAVMVRDLEYIAQAAGDLLNREDEPSDTVWQNIQNELKSAPPDPVEHPDTKLPE